MIRWLSNLSEAAFFVLILTILFLMVLIGATVAFGAYGFLGISAVGLIFTMMVLAEMKPGSI